ncbi:MAG: hypothetical protein ACUVQ0_03675 [Thermoproteota archaeon]
MKNIAKIIIFIIILLILPSLGKTIESAWMLLTGYTSNGLSSLATLLLLAFSITLILPLKDPLRNRFKGFFKKALVFLTIWMTISFFVALMGQSRHAPIGFAASILYLCVKHLGPGKSWRIICEETSLNHERQGILLSIAPSPRIVFLHRLDFNGLLCIVRRRSRVVSKTPEKVFMKSFKYSRSLEFQGSLLSLASILEEIRDPEVVVLCEAVQRRESLKVSVRIASDNPGLLNRVSQSLSRIKHDYPEDFEAAFEKWYNLKSCVKPVTGPEGLNIPYELIYGRTLIVGEADDFALQVCLSQLRRNSMILIVGNRDPVFEEKVRMSIKAGCLRQRGIGLRACKAGNGVEIFFAEGCEIDPLRKWFSKPLVAVWFRDPSMFFDIDAPVKLITARSAEEGSRLEVDKTILVNCNSSLAEYFLPTGYGLLLQGRTILLTNGEVRILK